MDDRTIARRQFLALTGAVAAGLFSKSALAAEPLAFGYDAIAAWGALGMVARAKGIFKKAGADVDFHTFDSGKSTRDAMVSGHIDVGILGSTPFIIGAAKGDMEAIAMAMYAGKTESVFAGAKSGIKSVKDLKGHRVASQLGTSTNWVFMTKVLPKYGLSASDIRVINTPGRNMVAALVSGSVDAFVGGEPYVSTAEVDGLGTAIVDFSPVDMLPVFLAANRPVVEKRPKDLIAFLHGWLETAGLFEKDPAEAADIIRATMQAQGFKISKTAATLLVSKLGVNPHFVPQLKPYLEAQSKLLISQHVIRNMPDWNKLLDDRLLKQATVA